MGFRARHSLETILATDKHRYIYTERKKEKDELATDTHRLTKSNFEVWVLNEKDPQISQIDADLKTEKSPLITRISRNSKPIIGDNS